ncbi:MAG: hypothetical protein ACP5JP_09610 [bacterium]
MNKERKIVMHVIRIGSYTGIGLLAVCFVLELMSNVVHIDPPILHILAFSGIVILIFTPVFTMLSMSIYFAYQKQWKWVFMSALVGVLIVITFIVLT